MAVESNFQGKVARWLRSKGCFVIIMSAVPGVPDGMTDVVALIPGGGWATLEIKGKNPFKADGTPKKGAFRPLQLLTIKKLDAMYYSRAVWPEIWPQIRAELEQII